MRIPKHALAYPWSSCVLAVGSLLLSSIFAHADEIRPDISAQLSHGPASMTITPRGDFIVAIHQAFRPTDRVIRLARDGSVGPFPNFAIAGDRPSGAPFKLDSVQGIECDGDAIVWMVDNGRRGESVPKVVGWNSERDELHKIYYLPAPATLPSSFLDDIAVDPEEPYLYICDPAGGSDAAMLVINRETGLARRVLQGHHSVIPDPSVGLRIENGPITAIGLNGSKMELQTGINPIAVDRKGDWVYFGPRMGTTLFRIRAEHLQNQSLTGVELESRVEGYAEKPICDGISIDVKGNIYLGDLPGRAVGVINAKERKYRRYSEDPRFLWIDGFCFGPDGNLYGYASQLHRSALFNRGRNLAKPPFYIFRIKPLASGMVGR